MFGGLVKLVALQTSLTPSGQAPAEDPALVAAKLFSSTDQIALTDTVKTDGQKQQAPFVVPDSLNTKLTATERLNAATVDSSGAMTGKDSVSTEKSPKLKSLTEEQIRKLDMTTLDQLPAEHVVQAFKYYRQNFNSLDGDLNDRLSKINFQKFEETVLGYQASYMAVEKETLMDKFYNITGVSRAGNKRFQEIADDLMTVEALAFHLYGQLKVGDPRITSAVTSAVNLKFSLQDLDKLPADSTKTEAMRSLLPELADANHSIAGATLGQGNRNELERTYATRYIFPVDMLLREIETAHANTLRSKPDRNGNLVRRGKEEENLALWRAMERAEDIRKAMLNLVHEGAQAGVKFIDPSGERFYNDGYSNPGKAPGNQSRE